MLETPLAILLSSSACIVILYIFSLRISQHINSPYLLYFSAIASFISIVFTCVYVKLSSSQFIKNELVTFALGGFASSTAFKCLELAFAYKWTYIQQTPLKVIILYFLALPKMPESETKLGELSKENVHHECIGFISRGVCQLFIFRTIIYLIPREWLSVSSLSISLIPHYIRYGLLGALLYTSMDSLTSIVFGIYMVLFNLRINPVFPKFPFGSTSLRDFWSHRWNYLVKNSLQLISFVIIPKLFEPILSMSNTTKGIFTYFLSGCLHEFVIWFISGKWSGKNMIFFLLHGLFVLLENKMKLPKKTTDFQGKLIGWLWATGIILITSPLFFDPYIEAGVFSAMK